jgi:DNA replication licensing factor MCM7
LTGAFEEFLSTYESTASDLDAEATDALESLNIDENDSSDEYVMVDNELDGKGVARRPGQRGQSKKKYMDMLQRVADRQIAEVTIELDDLENASFPESASKHVPEHCSNLLFI